MANGFDRRQDTDKFATAPLAQAEPPRSASFYNRNGSFAGSVITRGNSTSFYDSRGHFNGSAIRNSDGTTSFYDARGHFHRIAQRRDATEVSARLRRPLGRPALDLSQVDAARLFGIGDRNVAPVRLRQ